VSASGLPPTCTRLVVDTSVRQRTTTLCGVPTCRYGPRVMLAWNPAARLGPLSNVPVTP
jgi:hypothetical protein